MMMRVNLIRMVPAKRCTKCLQEKPAGAFYNTTRGGLISPCRACFEIYRAKPEVRARTARYNASIAAQQAERERLPEVRQKRAEYRNRPETLRRALFFRNSQEGRFYIFELKLREHYGIDAEDWARLYNTQDGKCAGCQKRLLFDRTTHVDHCHATGKVRGLLCAGCNSSLGHAKDKPETLRALALYVERHR